MADTRNWRAVAACGRVPKFSRINGDGPVSARKPPLRSFALYFLPQPVAAVRQTQVRDETKRQIAECYAGVARMTGYAALILALWSGFSVVKQLVNREPFGTELLSLVILGVMAALLMGARSEYPPKCR